MRKKILILHLLLLLIQYVYLAFSLRDIRVGIRGGSNDRADAEEQSIKAEAAAVPILTLSPPEGNTTFLDGTTWCVALPAVEDAVLQRALDWACGPGSADCGYIERGRECFEPNTLPSHASFAFNNYYQQNGNSDIACNFGGVAYVTTRNPSYGICRYQASSDMVSASTRLAGIGLVVSLWWGLVGIMLLLYF